MEYNDIYDVRRNRTGKIHRRGTPWKKGEYGFVVCVWVYDGEGKVLMTRRAPQKSFAGTWENSGGSAQAGEESLQAIVREVYEELGLRIPKEKFHKLAVYVEPGRIAAFRDGSVWRMVVMVFGLELEEEPQMTISAESKDLRFFSKEELNDIEIVITAVIVIVCGIIYHTSLEQFAF